MVVRRYRPGEELELRRLFFDTVRTVNVRDYSEEQVRTWAPEEFDVEKWRARIEANDPFVCVDGNSIVGFADIQESGYIDQFYVHHDWQGRGVGSALLAAIHAEAEQRRMPQLWSNVSITARPFFESRGFQVEKQQEVTVGSVVFTNFRMVKQLIQELHERV